MAVNMSEIKKYIYEHGSKQVLNSEYKALFRVIKTGNPRFDQKYFESIKSRISEVLPNEGNIVLSDLDVKIVMHNFGKKGYSEAGFNVAKGQPYIVNEDIIDYKDLIPVSELEIIEFQGSKPVNFREYNEEETIISAYTYRRDCKQDQEVTQQV